MNKTLILIVALLALLVGIYWWRTESKSPMELAPTGPASTSGTAQRPTELSSEESRSATPMRESAPSKPASESTGTATSTAGTQPQAAGAQAAPAKPLEVPGSLPSVGPERKDPGEFVEYQEKYAQATSAELLSAYQALQDYYQMHFDGRIEDKNQRLSVEALEALAREIAWLKERAINGPGDG